VNDVDAEVRLCVYRRFIESGRPPTVQELAGALNLTFEKVEKAYHRLDEGHALVLKPGTLDLWMAMPLSAVPTDFRVSVAGQSWWANCAWDALGIPAMLGRDALIETHCPGCDDPVTFKVINGGLEQDPGVVHFALPVAKWWEDIGFT
jgi:hypothetical protein